MAETTYEPYRESDDHVPSSTDISDQLDTTATGGPNQLNDVVPIFQRTAAQNLVEASEALKSDDPLASANVILPDDKDDRAAAIERLHAKADEHREAGVVTASEQQELSLAAGAGPAGGDPIGAPAATGPGDAGAPSSLVSNAGSTPAKPQASTGLDYTPAGGIGLGQNRDSSDGGVVGVSGSELSHEERTAGASTNEPADAAKGSSTLSNGTVTTSQAAKTTANQGAVGGLVGSGDEPGSSPASTTAPSTSSSAYDPSKYGVEAVQKHMDEHPDEAEAIKKAEYEGVQDGGVPKKRSTIRDYKVK